MTRTKQSDDGTAARSAPGDPESTNRVLALMLVLASASMSATVPTISDIFMTIEYAVLRKDAPSLSYSHPVSNPIHIDRLLR